MVLIEAVAQPTKGKRTTSILTPLALTMSVGNHVWLAVVTDDGRMTRLSFTMLCTVFENTLPSFFFKNAWQKYLYKCSEFLLPVLHSGTLAKNQCYRKPIHYLQLQITQIFWLRFIRALLKWANLRDSSKCKTQVFNLKLTCASHWVDFSDQTLVWFKCNIPYSEM